jgi:hypothetical protein
VPVISRWNCGTRMSGDTWPAHREVLSDPKEGDSPVSPLVGLLALLVALLATVVVLIVVVRIA